MNETGREQLYNDATGYMEEIVHYLTRYMPPPILVGKRGYRYAEQNAYCAIVQKMARIVSTLRASLLLLDHGFIQEQALMCRIIDEAEVDVHFLAFGIIFGETELHKKFLEAFYQEECEDPERPVETRNKRIYIPRDKIFSFILEKKSMNGDKFSALEIMKTIHKTMSGFVHGSSPSIMEMYGEKHARFEMNGKYDLSLWQDHIEDISNYIYRGLGVFFLAAHIFGEEQLSKEIQEYYKRFPIEQLQ